MATMNEKVFNKKENRYKFVNQNDSKENQRFFHVDAFVDPNNPSNYFTVKRNRFSVKVFDLFGKRAGEISTRFPSDRSSFRK